MELNQPLRSVRKDGSGDFMAVEDLMGSLQKFGQLGRCHGDVFDKGNRPAIPP